MLLIELYTKNIALYSLQAGPRVWLPARVVQPLGRQRAEPGAGGSWPSAPPARAAPARPRRAGEGCAPLEPGLSYKLGFSRSTGLVNVLCKCIIRTRRLADLHGGNVFRSAARRTRRSMAQTSSSPWTGAGEGPRHQGPGWTLVNICRIKFTMTYKN